LSRDSFYLDPESPAGSGFTKKDAIAECSAELVVLSVVPTAPETDVAAAVPKEPVGGPLGVALLVIFVFALLLAALWFPLPTAWDRSRRLRTSLGRDPPRSQNAAVARS
jgi:hypothetical protein